MVRRRFSGKPKRSLASSLKEALRQTVAWVGCFAIVAQPLMAQTANIAGDGGAQSPTVYDAANGVTVVDIKTPNGAGLSHNTYRDFSVGSGGAILNNSGAEFSQSQLGGLLQGNANLNGVSAAGVILNEITSTNRSLLQGAIEVHGTSAAVVVANPNGITCDGCGFINTPRVTLSTGVPKLGADGSLATLRVEKGDVLIGPNGASLGTVDIFDIVSRKISVQGPVNAKRQLNLIAGRNELAWQTGLITPLASDGSEPGISIDSSLLGGMYAGAIKIISNDRGSGVNMQGQMAANAGQMQITADGRLVMGKARASGGIVAKSKRSTVRATNTLFSEKSVILEGLTRAEIAAGAMVASSDDVYLGAGEIALEDGAIVAAGVTSSGAMNAGGSLTVRSGTLQTSTSRLMADTDVTVTASKVDVKRSARGASTIEAGRNVTLNTGAVEAQNALVVAGQALAVSSTGALSVEGGQFSAGTTARVSGAGAVTNSAEIGAKSTLIATAGSGSLTNSGKLAGNGGTTLVAQNGDVQNSGNLLSQLAVAVTATGTITNTGTGQIAAGSTVTLKAHNLQNIGSAIALGSTLQTETTGTTTNTGTLRSDRALAIKSDGAVSNTGKLLAQGAFALEGTSSTYAGAFSTGVGSEINGSEITIKAVSATNSGDILARTDDAKLASTGDVSSSGRILSTKSVDVRADGKVTVTGGEVTAAEAIKIAGETGTHAGDVSLGGAVSAVDEVSVSASALAVAGTGDVVISGGKLVTEIIGTQSFAGQVRAKDEIALKADGTTSVTGKLLSDAGISLASRTDGESGALTLSAAGEVNGKTIDVKVASLTSSGAIKSWGGAASVQTSGLLTNTGFMEALGALSIGADAGLKTSGAIRSNEAITVTSRSGMAMQSYEVQTGGAVESGTTLTVTTSELTNAGQMGSHAGKSALESSGAVSNSGTLFAKGAFSLKSDSTVGNTGRMVADDALTLSGLTGTQSGAVTTTSGSEISGSTVAVTSSALSNGGDISSRVGNADLSISGNVTNAGRVLSAKDLALQTDGTVTVTAGELSATETLTVKGLTGAYAGALSTAGLLNAGKAANVTAQSVTTTASGQIAAFDGALAVNAKGTLSNAGKLIGKMAATLLVDGAVSNAGDILVEDGLTIKGTSGTASGALTTQSGSQINAGTLTAEVASLQNTGSVTAHDDDAVVKSAGAITNAGSFEAVRDAALETNTTLTNSGRLLAGNDLTIKGLSGPAAAAVSNQFGARLEAGRVLSITASSLNNAGNLGSHGTGTSPRSLDIALSSSATNSSTIFAKGAAQINASSLTNSGKILTDGALSTIARLTNRSGAELTGKSITSTSGTLSNAGSIRSHAGDLSLDARSSFSNTGTIEARGNAALILGQSQVLTSGKLSSTGTLSLTGLNGGSFGNLTVGSGYVLNGTGGLTLSVSNLTNNGGVGSATGAVNVSATGSITNKGLLYSGTSARYRLNGNFTNSGTDVLSEQNLTIEGLGGTRAGHLLNDQGGIIEAVFGNMTLRVSKLTNSRTAPTITQTSSQAVTYEGNPDTTPTNGTTAVWTTVTTTTTRDQAALTGAAAKILAGGNITVDSGETLNSYSQIAASGNVTMTGGNVTNLGQDLIEEKKIDKSNRHIHGYCKKFFGLFGCRKRYRTWHTNSSTTESSTVGAVYGTIEAGQNLSISAATGYVANTALRSSAGQVGLASGARAMGASSVSGSSGTSGIGKTTVSGASGTGGLNAPKLNIASLASALQTLVAGGSSVPSLTAGDVTITGVPQGPAGLGLSALAVSTNSVLGRSALFDTQLSPNMPFLVETRPDFIDRAKYLGSDYVIKRLGGFDSNKAQKRFGDAYVETRLIRDQIFELTGSRFVGDPSDMRGQMQALYDNAVDESQRLGLTVGTALSASQVAALQNDITWLETQTVRGQQVLVPRVYLSRATLANLDLNSGQLRAGGTTTITAAALQNTGSITGQSGLELTTTIGVSNVGGSLFSGADIEINGGSLFDNRSGQVTGSNIQIAATTLTLDTLKTRDLFEGGFRDRAQQRARIAATGSLTLTAGTGGVTGEGIDLSAGSDLSLTSAGNVNLKALALDFSRESETSGGKDTASSRTHTLASLSAGGNLTVRSEGDLGLTGVTGTAGGNSSITAKGKVDVASVQDMSNRNLTLDFTDSGLFKTKVEVEQSRNAETLNRSIFSSGGDLLIESDTQNVSLKAIGIKADGTARVVAENGKVQFKTVKDSLYERDHKRTEDLFWWKEKDKGVNRTDLQYVSIEAGGGLKLSAGKGIEVEYAPQGSATKGIAVLAAKPGMSWMKDLQNDPTVDWQDIETSFEEWDYEAEGLTEAGALLVTAITTFATAGTGGLVSKLSSKLATNLGVTSAAGQAAIKAGVANLINRSAVAVVNNKGNLAAAFSEVASADGMKSLITSMITAGLSAELIQVAGITPLTDNATAVETFQYKLSTGLISNSVNSVVSTAINGGDLGDSLIDGWSTAFVQAGLATTQHAIGDWKDANGISDGAAADILAHAAAGCIAGQISGSSCADGAAAGALSAILAPSVGGAGWDQDKQIAAQNLFATGALLLAGSDAQSASVGGQIAGSAHENNYLNHTEERWLNAAEEQLLNGGCAEDAEVCFDDPMQVFVTLFELDAARDAQLSVCVGSSSPSCVAARTELYRAYADYEEAIYENPDLMESSSFTFYQSRTAQQFARYGDDSDFGDTDLGLGDYNSPNAQRINEAPPSANQRWAEMRSIPGTVVAAAEAGSGVGSGVIGRMFGLGRSTPAGTGTTRSDPRINSADQRLQGVAPNNVPIGSRAAEKVTWTDEGASMSPRARAYDEGAMGSRSNIETQRGQAPALTRTREDGSTATVRFDGVDGDVLVDRKLSVVTTPKAKDQAARQSAALAENGLTGRWEVPTQAQANRANRVFEELGIENITVRVIPE